MSETEGGDGFVYDEVVYPTPVMAAQTPDQIGASAVMHGWTPPDPLAARVLEVGCGNGFNLIGMAANSPGLTCVGFDLSASAIASGKALIEMSGLKNVELHQGDITTWPRDGEKFDYISCHGVYTWIPPAVRPALLELYGALLAPGGIAYLSYDCLPASGPKRALNRFLVEHVEPIPDIAERVDAAVEMIFLLARHQRPESRLKPQFDHLVRDVTSYPRSYFYHDWLAPFYDPTSLEDLYGAAAKVGLQMGGDTALHDLYTGDLDDEAKRLVASAGDDLLERTKIMDMLRGSHMFRADLMVRTDTPPARLADPLRRLTYAFLGVRTEVDYEGGKAWRYGKGDTVYATAPTTAAETLLDVLLEASPAEFGFDELLTETRLDEPELRHLLNHFTVMGLLDTHVTPQNFVLEPGERPRAGRLVRTMLAADETAITLRHLKYRASEAPTRLMLALCDGTRTRAEIAESMTTAFGEPVPLERVTAAIAAFAPKALFEA